MDQVKVPSLGESETEATLVSWLKQEGDAVQIDDVLAEIESDKITMEITALSSGVLTGVNKQMGEIVAPGEVIAQIDASQSIHEPKVEPASNLDSAIAEEPQVVLDKPESVSPKQIDREPEKVPAPVPVKDSDELHRHERIQDRVPMTSLRKKIAKRLKESQNTAAILTTFNEVDMSNIMEIRSRYRVSFKEKYGVDLGFMSFFVRACVSALKQYPVINAFIDGEDVVYHGYFDIGVAVSTDRGLVVPVLRDVQKMNMADIESSIVDYAAKAKNGKLLPADLKGGTFSISNGGVFGSMLSTPILNPPQSAILGMHTIQKRAVVRDDQVVVRPMMYLALSYDHRLVDGRDAVLFLRTVKEELEYPGMRELGL